MATVGTGAASAIKKFVYSFMFLRVQGIVNEYLTNAFCRAARHYS